MLSCLHVTADALVLNAQFFVEVTARKTPQIGLKSLNELTNERVALRGDLSKALQRALRDIRSYAYEYYDDMQNFRWLPNNRYAKRDRRPRQKGHERAGEDYNTSHDIHEDN
ncbi:hypothetical protein Aduo_015634 [Ancylostoma duodenale]